MVRKVRLDVLIHERGLAPSRSKAQAMIMAGEVSVDGQVVDKAGMRFSINSDIIVRARPPYVSRGGEKLAAALDVFQVQVTDKVCADVGASTGGFTDCLLQYGCRRVYAIDVGYGQLAHSLRIDPRVNVMERTNARHLETLGEPIDMAVVDASYISLRLLLPAIQKWLKPEADVIALIKPQFEAGREEVGKGGVVRDAATHQRVLTEILQFALEQGFIVVDLLTSPIKGLKSGNTEYLAWLHHGEPVDITQASLEALVNKVLDDR